jgi:hypothetical protein
MRRLPLRHIARLGVIVAGEAVRFVRLLATVRMMVVVVMMIVPVVVMMMVVAVHGPWSP